MTRLPLVFAAVISTLVVAVVTPQAQSPRVEPVTSPAGARSEAPQLTVSDKGVLMSWIERGENNLASLKFAERTATGWSEVRTVASDTDWFVNWADVPSVLRLADNSLVGHWLQKSGPSTYAYDVRLSRSTDNGRTWSPSVTPHHDGTQTEHGFASLFQMPGAGLGLIWLDGRQMTPAAAGGGEHDGHGTGAMTIRYGAFDGAWKQTADMAVDLRVCECCPTTAAVTSDGLIAAFRNRTEDEIRDIYVARFENGKWTEPKAVHNDNWQIAACPVNGPMLSASGRDVVISWFTGVDDPGRAYVAFSKDAGRTFSAPIRVDDEATLGRVDVELMPDGSAMASWIELGDRRAEFKVRRIQPDGTRGAPIKVADMATSRSSGYPRIARHGNELLFAWTEVVTATPGSRPTTQVRTAVVR
ncbi:MAG: sialidase family protein [Acidobacteria bacterium]|nr:sialidase family protein [Acidobacteriota bacterium]